MKANYFGAVLLVGGLLLLMLSDCQGSEWDLKEPYFESGCDFATVTRSLHFFKRGLNESHHGFALSCYGWQLASYENSISNDSTYVGREWKLPGMCGGCYGNLGLVTGYDSDYKWVPAGALTYKWKYAQVSFFGVGIVGGLRWKID